LIEEAWADLQQLPAPWQGPPTEAFGDDSVIEFGALEEPESEEPDEGSPIAPEPAAECDEIDLTKQLNEIEMCVAQAEENAATISELEEDEEPADAVPLEEEAAPSVEMPVEPIDEVQSVIEPAEELSVPHTDNPFEESFDDEEIVVDHYSRLDTAGQSVVTAASCDQDRELAAAAEAILQGAEQQPPPAEDWEDESAAVEPAENAHNASIAEDSAFNEVIVQADREFEDRAHDTEYIDDQDHDADDADCALDDVDEPVSVQASVMRVPPPDDSDLIVVVDEEFDSGQASGDPGAHRQDYRRLFSRLRQI
jgi:hypothetical protein